MGTKLTYQDPLRKARKEKSYWEKIESNLSLRNNTEGSPPKMPGDIDKYFEEKIFMVLKNKEQPKDINE